MPEKDGMAVNGHRNWKLGVVLLLAAVIVATAALAVRSWAKQTYLQRSGQPVTSSNR
jgi:hypothetical protein